MNAVALVIASTVTHAWWNFLLKRAGGNQVFVGLSKASEVVLLAPVFVWMARTQPVHVGTTWHLVAVGAALVLLNYAALAKAYSSGHLSFVYPVSRGAVLLFLPPLGFLAFHERVSVLGGFGMTVIVCGIVLLSLPAFHWNAVRDSWKGLSTPATGFALAAAGFGAFYTIWDKGAINAMPVFHYFYLYTLLVATVYMALIRLRWNPQQIGNVWRAHRMSIVAVGALNAITYLMVLAALRDAPSSYVVAIRQLSIAWSVVLGVVVLREPRRVPSLVGALLILAGCSLAVLGR
jgi:uncharacterized membrane protein